MSLPLESLICNKPTPPMTIDYACGAGHFLTELALQLHPLLVQHKPQASPDEYHKSMVGIEKEYRLSKVAKVSAFMYGQQGIQICYGDGLVNRHEAFPDIRDGYFDLLVANPPYSVRGFLETLPEEERKAYSLNNTIKDAETANSIETFFVERAKQLLKSSGVAAIILPSSILSNGGSTFVRTREILLQYFDIVAIAEFGSGTFGKTGTNTVTLFLRRKPTQPDTAEHYRERVEEWFKGCAASKRKQVIYKDSHLIKQYCAHINVPLADYQSLLRGEAEGSWKHQAHFQPYHEKLYKSTELVKLHKQKKFKALSKAEQTAETAKHYLTFVQAIERDKLYHFCLAWNQDSPVLIIRSPSGTREIKQFLGYEWSSAKGYEGIKLIEDNSGKHITTLYEGPDHANPMRFTRANPAKLNSHIAANFEGNLEPIPAELSEVAIPARLVDMLDFVRSDFDKALMLAPSHRVNSVSSKWPTKPLEAILGKITGPKSKVVESNILSNGSVPVVTQSADKLINGYVEHSEPINDLPLIVFGDHTCTFKYIDFPFVRGADGTQLLKVGHSDIDIKYLYFFLSQLDIHNSGKYERHFKYLKVEPIPLPDDTIQKAIIRECEVVESQLEIAKTSIDNSRIEIEKNTEEAVSKALKSRRLGSIDVATINPPKTEIKNINNCTLVSFVEMASVSEGGVITNTVDRPLGELRKGSYTYFAENDIIIAKITPCMENGKCALVKGLTNNLGMGSSEFHVIRAKTANFLPEYLFALLNRKSVRQEAEKFMTGASGHRRVPASFYEEFTVPVISLAEQKKFVAKIEAQHKKIAKAQADIDAAPAKKAEVMKKYL
jgi:type I restriction-modification system DNA methylase subunit